ncbi:PREDICTED: uncharacterized protein LOC109164772 [Ipomoea nil]|uniref:uncharacterized protein LOC109164772 n=1 Tax=Ipomoea nil TaxID=35883 RepID=UPI000900AC8D|nr:PREDICTED: uncharacterized protein LOC109164772 [Ipomoea nil]
MAKMLANRMKPLREGVISESQSAFIPDRLITDNILLAAEVGHFLNRKQCGVGGWSALKLDMAKAYDRTKAEEATEVKRCLSVYENLSGQAVNYHKSSICYSRNTSDEDRKNVAQILGVAQAPNYGKYLGLPSFIGRHKKAVFAVYDDRKDDELLLVGFWN